MVNEEKIVDGVKITEDGDVTHFVPVEEPKQKPSYEKEESKGFFEKIGDWWNSLWIKPYVKIRDLADPFGDRTDPDAGSDGKSAAEIGIKISF